MADFLFHQLSEKEKGSVKRDAKKILDSFSKKLLKVRVPDEEQEIERKDFERREGKGSEGETEFRNILFENAPNKNKDFIIAEKKNWE